VDSDDLYDEGEQVPAWWRRFLLPVAVLIVSVGIMSALVLGGILRAENSREAPGASSTTVPTIEINP